MADILKTPAKDRQQVTRAEATQSGPQFAPRVDIYETDKELTVFADLPGVAPNDVDLHYEKGELVLRGKVQKQQPPNRSRQLLMEEFEVGDFYRVFSIHESIDAGRIEAECKNGVLTVHLPKVEAARPRQISVKTS
jgi:HSP20 family protein